MLFPYSTDAPIRYWPYATLVVIGVNIFVFALGQAFPGIIPYLALQTGQGLHPLQWLTASFVTDNFGNLFWNAACLWTFSLIVEGKLGWWKTLCIYLGVAVGEAALEQICRLGGTPELTGGAGAIAIAYMAMSVVWAPENSIHCMFFAGWYYFRFNLSVKVAVAVLLGLVTAYVVAAGLTLSSRHFALAGAAAGFCIASWLVKTRRVDCENWDIYSIAAGRNRMSVKERLQHEMADPRFRRWQEERQQERTAEALTWIRTQLRNGNAKAAAEVNRRVGQEVPEWKLPEQELCDLIAALEKASLATDAIPLMAEYLSRFAKHALVMRISLAHALVAEKRPAQALKVMEKLVPGQLAPRQRQIICELQEKSKKLHADDPYEVADEDW